MNVAAVCNSVLLCLPSDMQPEIALHFIAHPVFDRESYSDNWNSFKHICFHRKTDTNDEPMRSFALARTALRVFPSVF